MADDDLTALLAPFRAGAESLWAVPPDDRLTAALNASALTENDVRWVRNAADLIRALPSLVGAIEAVLKDHARQEQPVRSWDLDLRCPAHKVSYALPGIPPEPSFAAVRDCPDCTYRDRWVCVNPDCREHEWPCPTYLAIRTALTGQESGNA